MEISAWVQERSPVAASTMLANAAITALMAAIARNMAPSWHQANNKARMPAIWAMISATSAMMATSLAPQSSRPYYIS